MSSLQLDEGSEAVGDPWSDDALSEGNDWAESDESLESAGDEGFEDPEELDDQPTSDDESDD